MKVEKNNKEGFRSRHFSQEYKAHVPDVQPKPLPWHNWYNWYSGTVAQLVQLVNKSSYELRVKLKEVELSALQR